MKKIFKVTVAGLIAASVATTGLIVQSPTAEAGLGLGSIGKSIGDAVTGGKGSGVDIEGLNHNQSNMLNHLYYSVALLNAAVENVKIATNDSITNKTAISAKAAALSAQKNSDAGLNMKNGAEQTKTDMSKSKEYLSEALKSGDEEKLKQIDAMIKEANSERLLSDTIGGYAGAEATKIVTSTLKALKNPGELGPQLNQLSKAAKETQNLLKVRNELSKALSDATKEYKSKRGIKDPSKDEQKKAAAEIEKG